jgi:hypothetical protein
VPQGRVETTYASAWPALVTKDFSAAIRPSPSGPESWLTGAQKWLRDPFSLKASVPRQVPSAIARIVSESPPAVPASTTCAAQTCMR